MARPRISRTARVAVVGLLVVQALTGTAMAAPAESSPEPGAVAVSPDATTDAVRPWLCFFVPKLCTL